jgi:hypothetical protein
MPGTGAHKGRRKGGTHRKEGSCRTAALQLRWTEGTKLCISQVRGWRSAEKKPHACVRRPPQDSRAARCAPAHAFVPACSSSLRDAFVGPVVLHLKAAQRYPLHEYSFSLLHECLVAAEAMQLTAESIEDKSADAARRHSELVAQVLWTHGVKAAHDAGCAHTRSCNDGGQRRESQRPGAPPPVGGSRELQQKPHRSQPARHVDATPNSTNRRSHLVSHVQKPNLMRRSAKAKLISKLYVYNP